MLKIADYNTLVVKELAKGGCYLEGGTRNVYLPKIDVPRGARVGDRLRVFVYNDTRTILKATTMPALAVCGDFVALRVKSVTEFGAFLEWGIPKDLFVPLAYQQGPLHEGETVVVRLVQESDSSGVVGTCQLYSQFDPGREDLQEGQEVDLLVYKQTDLGWAVVVNNRYRGILYHNEIFEKLKVGDKSRGYIKKLRSDGRIDAVLQRQGFRAASQDARTVIMQALEDAGGFLPLHDKSSPELIKNRLNLSKKIFKKVIGGLYKEHLISIEGGGIRLKKIKKVR